MMGDRADREWSTSSSSSHHARTEHRPDSYVGLCGQAVLWRSHVEKGDLCPLSVWLVTPRPAEMIACREEPMRRLLWVISIACAITVAGLASTGSQQTDLETIKKRVVEFNNAGNYAAGLLEAQKLETESKKLFGESHPKYAEALVFLGYMNWRQGRYPEAEQNLKRAVVI